MIPNQEVLFTMFEVQAVSADWWVKQWEQHKDIPGLRNAALSIGKLAGIHQVIRNTFRLAGEQIPEHITKTMEDYEEALNNLHHGAAVQCGGYSTFN